MKLIAGDLLPEGGTLITEKRIKIKYLVQEPFLNLQDTVWNTALQANQEILKLDQELKRIEEKPEVIFKINTGFYILEPHLLKEIPENKFFHITSLIEKIQSENRRVGVFPVSEKSWIDIGNWNEYTKFLHL